MLFAREPVLKSAKHNKTVYPTQPHIAPTISSPYEIPFTSTAYIPIHASIKNP